jgi:hypothetical protein
LLGELDTGGLLGRLVWIGALAGALERIAKAVAAMATTAPPATAMLIGSRFGPECAVAGADGPTPAALRSGAPEVAPNATARPFAGAGAELALAGLPGSLPITVIEL